MFSLIVGGFATLFGAFVLHDTLLLVLGSVMVLTSIGFYELREYRNRQYEAEMRKAMRAWSEQTLGR